MAINLEALSHKELEDLINSAESHIKASRADTIKTTRGKIEALLTSNSLTLAEVFPTRGGGAGKSKKTGTVAPKYQNPSNTTQTWSGRGKRPLWFVDALKGRGVTAESLLIALASKTVVPAKANKSAKVLTKKVASKKAAKNVAKK
jgi:DNA-binding protein H-NS